jgi:hypothetical protein
MHKLPAVADLVFQYNTMDKTLKDYIDRTQKKIKEDHDKPLTDNSNQYTVLPENPLEEDKPQNPYGQH